MSKFKISASKYINIFLLLKLFKKMYKYWLHSYTPIDVLTLNINHKIGVIHFHLKWDGILKYL